MLWIKEVEMVGSVDDLKSSRSIRGTHGPNFEFTRRENCFSTEQNHPEYPLQEKGQSGGNERSKRRPLPPRKTDRLLDLRVLPGHWSQPTILSRILRTYLQLFFENDDIWEFDSKWDEILLQTREGPESACVRSPYRPGVAHAGREGRINVLPWYRLVGGTTVLT